MYPYRIFICYSHEDLVAVQTIAKHLDSMGLKPILDKDISPGRLFTEEIKYSIKFSHVFMPIITKVSNERPWVHQEIGYAMGVGVPVMPLVVGELPKGLIQQLQALDLGKESGNSDNLEKKLKELLTEEKIETIINSDHERFNACFECMKYPTERTEMLGLYPKQLFDMGSYGMVRQIGTLTSFCIPNRSMSNPIWDKREGKIPRSEYYRKLQRQERKELERHARKCGCKLIINTDITYENNGPGAREARLIVLLEFLKGMPNDKVELVIRPGQEARNLLIVGDLFSAESMTPRPGEGYYLTVFTRHAPTVLEQVNQFDEEFQELLIESVPAGKSSRENAIIEIEKIIGRN